MGSRDASFAAVSAHCHGQRPLAWLIGLLDWGLKCFDVKQVFFCYNGVNVRGRYERNEKEKI